MITRRAFVKTGLSSLLAAWALGGRRLRADRPPARAKACVLLWLNGGPSHVDTFDPKPSSKFKKIDTRVEQMQFCEHLPYLAEVAQHLAVVRGMTSREGNHDRARYLLHTGYPPTPTVEHPTLGAWVVEELGDPTTNLPGFVAIGGPSQGAGFLGVEHAPYVIGSANQPLANVGYARDVDMVRFMRRKGALDALDAQFLAETGDAKVKSRDEVYAKAVRMMHSPRLKAFELGDEPDSVRAAYGASDFGKGVLMARRLVEAGVKFVEVTLDGWDTHQDNFGKTEKLMGALDPAFAALVRELDERSLLDSTLVLCCGEFGRTPKINANEGRDHHPQAWSAVLAGGGVRGGVLHGETDDEGAKVVKGASGVPDLFATVATLLGLDPAKEVITPRGRPVELTDKGKPIAAIMT
jgi:uncharacterized protein (DUF1501 family)